MLPKRILILDTGKEWGGGTNSLLELLKRIDKNKYHFTAIFYNNYKRGSDSNIKMEIEKLGIDFLLLEQNKQTVVSKLLKEASRLIFFFSKKLKKYFIFLTDYHFRIKPNSKNIADTLKRLKINLIYMNNQPSSNLEGIMAAKDANIPCIQHSRIGAELNSVEVTAVNNWLTKMICVSQGVKEMFVAQGIDASKCEVVYNGIAPDANPKVAASEIRKMWGVDEGNLLIGTVGSLIKRKRVNDLIEAVAEIQRQEAGGKRQDFKYATCNLKLSAKCMIVGGGPEKANLQKQVLKLDLQDKVIFTDFQTDAISYINAMDIFVLPSEKEGLPRAILEAMLMEKPVVACDTTGSSELVVDGKTGFLVPVKKPEIMADAILKLIASADLRKKFGQNGKTMVLERFSIGSYISGVSKIFEEVLN